MKKNISKILIFIFSFLFYSVAYAQISEFPTTAELAKRLEKGEGAFLIPYRPYKINKGMEFIPEKNFDNIEQFIKSSTTSYKVKKAELFLITPTDRSSEIGLKPDKINSWFLFIGAPGEYTISRFSHFVGSAYSQFRIFKNVSLESGKVKYIGDFISIFQPAIMFKKIETYYIQPKFIPDEIVGWFQKNAPNLSDKLIIENVLAASPWLSVITGAESMTLTPRNPESIQQQQ